MSGEICTNIIEMCKFALFVIDKFFFIVYI